MWDLTVIAFLFTSPIICCHRVIAKRRLFEQLKSSIGDIMTSLIPTCGRFLTSFRFDGLSRSIVRLSNPDVLFHRLIPRIHSYGGCMIIDSRGQLIKITLKITIKPRVKVPKS